MTTSAPAAPKVPKFALHKFCEIIPPCTEKEYAELKADIKDNGLRLPIKIFDGKILDGRSRYQACVDLEAEGHPVEFKQEVFFSSTKEVSADDALHYVISMNVKRRHLSASQRAVIFAKLVTTKLGGDRSVILPTEITQELAAKLAGVATKTVTDAVKVLERPELAKKVLDGELAVATAAKQIREEEEAEKKQSEASKDGVEDSPAFDADNAVEVYDDAEASLLNALVALANASSVGHAKEKARITKEHLDSAIVDAVTNAEKREVEQKKGGEEVIAAVA
jgi:hypothetical protein